MALGLCVAVACLDPGGNVHSSEELATDVRKPPLCRMCPACPVPTHSREHCRQRGLSAGSQIKATGKSCFFPEALGRGQQCSVLFPMSLRSYCVPRALLMRVCDHPPLRHRSACWTPAAKALRLLHRGRGQLGGSFLAILSPPGW